jgi:hypothetical protein
MTRRTLPLRVTPYVCWAALVALGGCQRGGTPMPAAIPAGATAPEAESSAPAFLVKPYLQLPTPTGMRVMWETNQKLPGRVEYGTTPDLGHSVDDPVEKVLHEVQLTDLEPGTTYFYRVHAGEVASDVYQFKTAPPPGTPRWRMILYGDSRSNPAIHHRLAELMATQHPDLLVHTGDIVANGTNHDSWRKEFFEPLDPVARSVPWVSTIGNHENDADNYFSYMALPGNEHYFAFDYANASIVCLDSNAWIQKGRDSAQVQWLTDYLSRKRSVTWTFVVFHHPLFSAHATRPINPLRWDWAPLLIDPANHVDGVLTGHDHFYARNYRMGRVAETPQPGVLFMTAAGGGASLYKTRARDYVAKEKSVHNFVIHDFDGERVTLTALDITGKEIERYVLTKEPTPPEEYCAYEVEELRQMLRLALAGAKPVHLQEREPGTFDSSLRVPTTFAVPMAGRLEWQSVPGWKMKQPAADFKLDPGETLTIPLQAEVAAGALARSPALTIRFAPGKFHNRVIELSPIQLAGPARVQAGLAHGPVTVDGRLNEPDWQGAEEHALLGLPPDGGRADRVQFLADQDWLYVGAHLDDPAGKVHVKVGDAEEEGSRLALVGEHVRVVLSDGKQLRMFAVTPDQVRYSSGGLDQSEGYWRGRVAAAPGGWSAEVAVPRKLFTDWSEVRVNVVHRRQDPKDYTELHLCPTYTMGNDADRLPDFRPADLPERFAPLGFAR